MHTYRIDYKNTSGMQDVEYFTLPEANPQKAEDVFKSKVDYIKIYNVSPEVNLTPGLLIAKHEKCIRILELINSAHKMKVLYQENLNQYGYLFPHLKERYLKKVESLSKAIFRLFKYYENQLK